MAGHWTGYSLGALVLGGIVAFFMEQYAAMLACWVTLLVVGAAIELWDSEVGESRRWRLTWAAVAAAWMAIVLAAIVIAETRPGWLGL